MLVRELLQRYAAPDGAAWWVAPDDGAPAPAEAERLQPATGLAADDVVLVAVPDVPGLPELLPASLPVGCHVVLLVEGGASRLPVGRLLDALDAAHLQVVDAQPVAEYGTAVTAVVGVRTDTLVVPTPRLADALGGTAPGGDAGVGRLLGEGLLGRLVWHARERELALQLETAQARPTADELAAVRRDQERTRAELARVRSSRTYRLAQRLAGGARRLRHPRRRRG